MIKPVASVLCIMLSYSNGVLASSSDDNALINQALSYYKKGDIENALATIQPVAQTNPKAMYNLGVIHSFRQDNVVKKKTRQLRAFQLYEKAAHHEYPPAMYMLSTRYKLGIGTKKDPEKALGWLKLAADKAQVQACYDLAVIYYKGLDGASVDHTSAIKYLKLAARRHHTEAQSLIGYMYAMGEGTAIDENKARRWLTKAADKGDKIALENLDRLDAHRQTAALEPQQYWTVD